MMCVNCTENERKFSKSTAEMSMHARSNNNVHWINDDGRRRAATNCIDKAQNTKAKTKKTDYKCISAFADEL